MLASMFETGREVPASQPEATAWYERAADGGDVGAQYLIASMYEKGLGVARDLRVALDWYAAAARNGDDAARAQARVIAEQLARERDS
jgi:TPR repeat protein